MDRKMILKYQKLARLATHTNDWLRKIAAADLEKSLYENRFCGPHGGRVTRRFRRDSWIG